VSPSVTVTLNKHSPRSGLVSMDYAKEYPVAMKAITEWIEKGLLKRKFHIVSGLDGAPSALPLLYSGGNTGKLCVVLLAPVRLVSHLASLGSSRYLNTKRHLGYKPCNRLRAVICLLIYMCCSCAFTMTPACVQPEPSGGDPPVLRNQHERFQPDFAMKP